MRIVTFSKIFAEMLYIGASAAERHREGRSLSIQLDMANQSSPNFTDDVGGSVENAGKTAAAAAAAAVAAASEGADDRDADDDEDLSYDEQDSVGERQRH